MNTKAPNPIELRDQILEEPNALITEATVRDLVRRGWPMVSILAELPGVSEADVRRALEAESAAA